MNNVRKRLIVFRVTDEEYARIKATSDSQGARCVSEFARAIMMGGRGRSDIAHDSADSVDLNNKLRSVEHRLGMLELYVSRLSEALSNSKNGRIQSES
jgi:hypothetical protein